MNLQWIEKHWYYIAPPIVLIILYQIFKGGGTNTVDAIVAQNTAMGLQGQANQNALIMQQKNIDASLTALNMQIGGSIALAGINQETTQYVTDADVAKTKYTVDADVAKTNIAGQVALAGIQADVNKVAIDANAKVQAATIAANTAAYINNVNATLQQSIAANSLVAAQNIAEMNAKASLASGVAQNVASMASSFMTAIMGINGADVNSITQTSTAQTGAAVQSQKTSSGLLASMFSSITDMFNPNSAAKSLSGLLGSATA